MSYLRTYAPTRKTEIGSLIETFMDDNNEHLSPDMWEKLIKLGQEIDNMVQELEDRIEELEGEE